MLVSSVVPARRRLSRHLSGACLALAAGALCLPAGAATLTWDTASGDGAAITDGTGTWQNGLGNWNTGAGDTTWNNATPDSAVFGGGGGGSFTITLGGAVTASGLAFNAGPAYTINANTLTLSGSSSVNVASGVSATIGSGLAGTIGLTKDGTGTLTLSGANTYSGATQVNAGVLRAIATGAIPTAITVASGAGFDANALNWNGAGRDITIAGTGPGGTPGVLYNAAGGEAQMRNVTLSGAATIGTSAGKLNVYGTITGGGNALTIAGTNETNFRPGHSLVSLPTLNVSSGRLRFEGDSTPAAAVTLNVNGGIADTWATRTIGANLAVNLNGGTLEANGGGVGTWNGPVTVPANSGITANNQINLNGAVSGAGTVTKAGAGTLVLGAGISSLGGLTIFAGQVQLGGTANYALTNLNGSGTLNKTGSGTFTISGTAGITGAVTVGAGLLRPTTANSLPSNLTVSGGASLDLNGFNFGASRDVTVAGTGIGGVPGALYNSQAAESNIRNVTLTGATTIGTSAGKLNINGTITGAGNVLTVAGTGETNMRTNNSFSGLGGITVGSGLLRLESTQAPAAALTITVNSGAKVDTYVSGADRSHGANLGLNLNGGTVGGEGGTANISTWNGPIAVSANSTVLTNRRVDFFGAVSGAGTLAKNGGDVLNIRGGVTSLGGLTINAGRVRLENSGLGSWTGTVTVNSGSVLSNYGNQTVSAGLVLAGSTLEAENNGIGTFNGAVSVTGTSTLNTGGAGTLAIGGAITGSANLNKTNTGLLQLSGNNSAYTGTLTAAAGIVRPTVANTALPVNLSISSGASLDLNGQTHTSRSVTLNGTGASGTVGAAYNSSNSEGWISGITLAGPARIGTSLGKFNVSGVINGGGNTLTVAGTGETNFRPGHSLVNLPQIQATSGRLRFEGDSAPAASVVVNANAGSIVDTWASRALGANLTLNLNGGTLEANGPGGTFTSTWSGPTTLSASSTANLAKDVVLAGVVSGAGNLTKNGAGTLTLGNAANAQTGKTIVNAGVLRVTTGNEQSLGTAPGAYTADQFSLRSGTLQVSGSSLVIDDATRGVTLGNTGGTTGTFLVDSGLSLTVGNPVEGANGTLRKAGAGTFNLTAAGNSVFNGVAVDGGVYRQQAGTTTINTTSTGLQVAAGAVYELNGGALRTDVITVASGGTFAWGGGSIGVRSGVGSAGGTDFTQAGYTVVRGGTTLAVTGNLDTSAGSTLRLHNSPTFYLNNGVRYNNLLVTGDLDLTDAGDALAVEINPYLLRPFSPNLGSGATDYGSLPLVAVTGSLTGAFNSFGTVLNDGLGFAQHTGAFTSAAALPTNTWYLEYAQNVVNPAGFAAGTYDLVYFHYKVAGYVPEPQTAMLALTGLAVLRCLRRGKGGRNDGASAPSRDARAPRSRLGY